jgi:hypothetical protein
MYLPYYVKQGRVILPMQCTQFVKHFMFFFGEQLSGAFSCRAIVRDSCGCLQQPPGRLLKLGSQANNVGFEAIQNSLTLDSSCAVTSYLEFHGNIKRSPHTIAELKPRCHMKYSNMTL